ncbi:hypothetical protein B0O99DRAFT_601847 [Bisporella sp. PMI_857]|nr:hypothetical protein B0O99DRAFT_601847 [Bisporella sp. PMI_857]
MARDLLCIPMAGVGVERAFSFARDICGYRRGQLQPTTIRSLLLVYHSLVEHSRTRELQNILFSTIDIQDMTLKIWKRKLEREKKTLKFNLIKLIFGKIMTILVMKNQKETKKFELVVLKNAGITRFLNLYVSQFIKISHFRLFSLKIHFGIAANRQLKQRTGNYLVIVVKSYLDFRLLILVILCRILQ